MLGWCLIVGEADTPPRAGTSLVICLRIEFPLLNALSWSMMHPLIMKEENLETPGDSGGRNVTRAKGLSAIWDSQVSPVPKQAPLTIHASISHLCIYSVNHATLNTY